MYAALGVDQMKTIAIGIIIGLVVLALILGFVIRAIVAKVIVLAVIVGLGLAVWFQRQSLTDSAKKCEFSFFGYHLAIDNDDLREACQGISDRVT